MTRNGDKGAVGGDGAPTRRLSGAAPSRSGITITLCGLLRARLGALLLGAALLAVTAFSIQLVPWLLRGAVDALHQGQQLAPALHAAGFMVIAAVVGAVARVGSRLLVFDAARRVERDLRAALFERLLAQEPEYFQALPVGEVLSRLGNDLTTVRLIFGAGVVALLNAGLVYAIAITLMVRVDPWLTLYAVLPLPVILGLGSLLLRALYQRSLVVQERLGEVGRALQEDLSAIAVIKGYSLESDRLSRLASMSAAHRDATLRLARLRGALWGLLGFLGGAAGLIVLGLGALAVTEGRITLGQLVQFNGHLALIVWPTLFLGWALSLFQRGRAAWSRLRELLDREPLIRDTPGATPLPRTSLSGALEVRDLNLERDGRPVLDKVSFRVAPGQSLAIVGPTGAGKTTLIDALPCMIPVPPESIFLDGQDITRVRLTDLRRAFGYAPQDAWLPSASVRENILWGLPTDTEFTDDERESRLSAAVAQAGLEADLAALPLGIDTVVGERGILLSGGQRQRVCLARALIGGAPILLLDDSLSSVDVQVERRILEALRTGLASRTLVLVTHRPTALVDMDQIIVLDQGRVVETGCHAELLAARGRYARLYEEQRLSEQLGSAGASPPGGTSSSGGSASSTPEGDS